MPERKCVDRKKNEKTIALLTSDYFLMHIKRTAVRLGPQIGARRIL